MSKVIRAFAEDESGATAIEYDPSSPRFLLRRSAR